MQREPAPDRLRAVEDLCNTANRIRALDTLGELRSAQAWAKRNGVGRRLRVAELEPIVAARETIRAFLADRSDSDTRANLNRLAAAIFGAPAIGTDGALTFAQDPDDVVAALVAPALGALLRDGLTGEGKRLKACAAPDCRWIFFDRSHASNSRWCDMDVCGARHKMRDYRARKGALSHHRLPTARVAHPEPRLTSNGLCRKPPPARNAIHPERRKQDHD